jgi:WD40 repeat protein
VAFSPNSKLLASCSSGGFAPVSPATVKFWDVATGREVRTLDWPKVLVVADMKFSPDGKLLATASIENFGQDTAVMLWNADDGKLVRTLAFTNLNLRASLSGTAENFRSLAFTADGKLLAAASSDGLVRFWNVADGRLAPNGFQRPNT